MATPPTPTLVPASLARRMACWLYEGLVLFALMMVAVLLQSALAIVLPALNKKENIQAVTHPNAENGNRQRLAQCNQRNKNAEKDKRHRPIQRL